MSRRLVARATSVPLVAATIGCNGASGPPAGAGAPSGGSPGSPPIVGTVLPPEPVARPAPDVPALMRALALRAVEPSSVARRVLYSWTTRAQAEALVGGEPVLTRVESPQYGPSAFDWAVAERAAKGDALAKLLFREGFAKKRFAWPNAYATASGGGGGRYGSVLMRIELMDDALFVDLVRGAVLGLDGADLPFETLAAAPERLAAVYWEAPGFREFVVLNDAAIARVTFGQAVDDADQAAERDLLAGLDEALRTIRADEAAMLFARFERTLAFEADIDATTIRRLAEEAADVPLDGLAHELTPPRTFRLGGPRAPLARPRCALKKTNDISFRRTVCEPEHRCHTVRGKCEIAKRPLAFGER